MTRRLTDLPIARLAKRSPLLVAAYGTALHAWHVCRNLGRRGAPGYLFAHRLGRVRGPAGGASRAEYRLHAKHAGHPLYCRAGSSDRLVFRQIFVDREYACIDDAPAPELIVDCGANVGYSAAYFLSRFPTAHVIAVEPDEANFELLRRNTAPYADRVTLIRTGVWSRPTGLVFSREHFRDGQEWAIQVRECRPGERPDLSAIDIGTILRESGFEKIDILKVDVEGAEAAIFSSNYESWIDKVDTFVIELHGQECADAFFKAIDRDAFDVSVSYDVTVCRRRRAQGATASAS